MSEPGYEARGDERPQGKQRGGRVATGVRHHLCGRHSRPFELGQAVGEALGKRVRLRVPAGALRLVAEPEGAGEVDHLHAGIDEHRRELGGRLVGQREEDEIRLARERRRIERRDFALEEMCERGQFTRRRGPRRGRRRDAPPDAGEGGAVLAPHPVALATATWMAFARVSDFVRDCMAVCIGEYL